MGRFRKSRGLEAGWRMGLEAELEEVKRDRDEKQHNLASASAEIERLRDIIRGGHGDSGEGGAIEVAFDNMPGNVGYISDGTLVEIDESTVRVLRAPNSSQSTVIHSLEGQVEKLGSKLAKKDREVTRLSREAKERGIHIANLRRELYASGQLNIRHSEQIRQMQSKIDKQTNAIKALEEKNANQRDVIVAQRESRQALEVQLPRLARQIEDLEKTRSADAEMLKGAREQVRVLEAQVKRYEESAAAGEKNSTSVRVGGRITPIDPDIFTSDEILRRRGIHGAVGARQSGKTETLAKELTRLVGELRGELKQAQAEAEEAREEAAKSEEARQAALEVFPRLGAEVTVTDRPDEKRISILWDGTRVTIGPDGLAEVDGEQVVWQAAETIEMLKEENDALLYELRGYHHVNEVLRAIGVETKITERLAGPSELVVENINAKVTFKGSGEVDVNHKRTEQWLGDLSI